MQFTIERQTLLAALNTLLPAVASRSTIPVLSGILIDAQSEQVELTASNLEQRIVLVISTTVDTPGQIVIPARTLEEWLKAVRGDKVTLEAINNYTKIKLTCHKATTTINCYAADEFPIPNPLDYQVEFSLPASDLANMIFLVQTATTEVLGDNRASSRGICLEIQDGYLRILGTDGFRMANYKIALLDVPETNNVIIPLKSLNALLNLLNNVASGGLATCAIADNSLQVAITSKLFKQGTIYLQRVMGNFPSTIRNYPVTGTSTAILLRVDLLAALNAAMIFARENDNRITLRFENETLIPGIHLSAVAPQTGKHEDFIEAEVDNTLLLTTNGELLLNWLRKVNCEKVKLLGTTEKRPLLLLDEGKLDYGFFLVMPMTERKPEKKA